MILLLTPVMQRPTACVLAAEGVGAELVHDGAVGQCHRDATRVRLLSPVFQEERLARYLQTCRRKIGL